jgi:fructokinase
MVFPKFELPVQVATAGEALIDLIPDEQGRLRACAGGAVYNLSRALGRQEIGALYLNPLSADSFGGQLADGLAEAGVRLARASRVQEPTSLAVVGLDAQGKASYSFYREGVADRQVRATQLCADCAPWSTLRAVATGCLALAAEDRDKYLPWLRGQRHAGRLVAVDANLRPAVVPDMDAYRASVMNALAQAHLVKVSDDDLQVLGYRAADPLRAAEALLERIPARWLALTLGARGAVLLQRGGPALAAAETEPVPVIDTVGAGDCFFGGLLAALLRLPAVADAPAAERIEVSVPELQGVLAHAVASASLCVMQTGCAPPTFAQVRARLRESPPRTRVLP